MSNVHLPAEPATVVVVEDQEDFREILVNYLQIRGFTTFGVGDGASLFALLKTRNIELLILDVILPDTNGFAIAKQLQNNRHCGIVMLTCLTSDNDTVEGLSSGADAYIAKGSSLEVIEATCRSVLRRLAILAGKNSTPIPPQPERPSTPSRQEVWHFHALSWTLMAPDNQTVKLSAAEKNFLLPMMRQPGKPVPRESLLANMGKSDTENHRRNLDVNARRLRDKVASALGRQLPLDSIYGVGYAFTAHIEILADSTQTPP